MADKPDRFILRFRDLVTGHGGTVDRHNEIVDARGYVWWGWWNKPGEQVPATTFTLFAKALRKGPFQILLLNSGQNKLYQAECKDIKWDPTGTPLASPEADATPKYYGEEKYLAWFKIGRITEAAGEDVKKYSYVQVDDFFVSEKSEYNEFYGKRIYSPEELQQQNRTIWFIRQAHKDDPSHYVRLLHPNRVAASDFPSNLLVTEHDKLLWLSDLHFGKHEFPRKSDDMRRELWNALQEALKAQFPLAGALMSGDFTWGGQAEGFRQCGEFVRDMLTAVNWDNNYFLTICPGNHDFLFSSDPGTAGAAPGRVSAEARQAYEEFYSRIFYLNPNEYLCCGRRYIINGNILVEIASLNSLLLQQYSEKFQGQGFVGDDQLKYAAARMGWDKKKKPSGAVRMVMLHHHLLPVTFREEAAIAARSSIVLDANAVIEWAAANDVDIVLHGHQHQPFCAKLSYPIRRGGGPAEPIERFHEMHVVGLGSTGVKSEFLGEVKTHTFGLLVFRPGSVTISIHPIEPGRSTPRGELWSVCVPIRREGP